MFVSSTIKNTVGNLAIPTKKPLHIAGAFYYINYEWLEGRLAIADDSDEMISQIRFRIEEAIDVIDNIPAAAKRRLRSLLRDL